MALGTPPSWQAWAVFRYFRKHRLLFLYKNTEQTANILPRQHPSYHQSGATQTLLKRIQCSNDSPDDSVQLPVPVFECQSTLVGKVCLLIARGEG